MKETIKDLAVNLVLLMIGIYGRVQFGGKFYSWQQKLALLLFGVAVVYILHLTKLDTIYQTTIGLVCGIVSPNIVQAIIKVGDRSEDKTVDKAVKKIDDLLN